jgi:hypothetical protein
MKAAVQRSSYQDSYRSPKCGDVLLRLAKAGQSWVLPAPRHPSSPGPCAAPDTCMNVNVQLLTTTLFRTPAKYHVPFVCRAANACCGPPSVGSCFVNHGTSRPGPMCARSSGVWPGTLLHALDSWVLLLALRARSHAANQDPAASSLHVKMLYTVGTPYTAVGVMCGACCTHKGTRAAPSDL